MLRSMYSGVSGMKGFQTKLDVIGNNIANVNTVGFKKSTINFQDLISQSMSNNGFGSMQVGLGAQTSSINVVHTPGSAMTTGVGTDLAIMGDGFFMVKDPANENAQTFLTRSGNFKVDAEGYLVTSQGYSVLDANEEAIQIDPAQFASFSINREGEVIGKEPAGNEVSLHVIGISNPPNPAGLRKFGGSLYEMTEAAGTSNVPLTATAATSLISSGMLEMSNVDLTEEFTEMIVAQRGFQANSRTVTTSDEVLQEVINLKR